jgi:DNA-binding transcriptional regulator YiaG
MHHDTDGGLENVWLENGCTIRQTPYGPAVTIHDVDGLTRAICMALTDKAGIVSGKEFRYIRQGGMALSQAALGKMPGVDEQSVARLEKTGRVPKWADKLIRLVYAAHANADAPIRRAIERARTVERLTSQRILVKESRHGWTPAIVNHEDDTAVA